MKTSTHIDAPNFAQLIDETQSAIQVHAQEVSTDRWQGWDIKGRPDYITYELLNYSCHVPLLFEGISQYKAQIQPNLPWADNHFYERVCGQPINPGTEWANWPWGGSANKHRVDKKGPEIGDHDWAYLAALIDADGSITIREDGKPHIVIHQVDKEYLRKIQMRFGVGQLRDQDNNSGLSDKQYLRWQISARDDLKWVLSNVLRHIKLKRPQAIEAFNNIPDADMRLVGNRHREPTFNHNYMQRFWPKFAGMTDGGSLDKGEIELYDLKPHFGIYHEYGDLNDLVNYLIKEPTTRQAYIPLFFPEDTGFGDGGRKPCTLGYQFIVRNKQLHIYYPMRSCDFVRHFRDDIYLGVRLLLWVLEKCRAADPDTWNDVRPGSYSMHCTSLHIFTNDRLKLFGKGR